MTRRGRPTRQAQQARKTRLTYAEMCDRVRDGDIITVHFDGIARSGHWYEDHMMNMFGECTLIHLTGNEYQVAEWPERGEGEACHS